MIALQVLLWVFLLYVVWLQSGDMTTAISRATPKMADDFEKGLNEKGKIIDEEAPEKEKAQFFCDYCGEVIPRKYWRPMIGFIMLRGKTKCCGRKIPRAFFVAEVINFVGMITILGFFHSQIFICVGIMAGYFLVVAFTVCAIKYKFRFKFWKTVAMALVMVIYSQAFMLLGLWLLSII